MTHQVVSCPGHQVWAPLPEMHGVGVQLPETLPSPVITVSVAPAMTGMKEKKDWNKEMWLFLYFAIKNTLWVKKKSLNWEQTNLNKNKSFDADF